MSEYFLKPKSVVANVDNELDLFNYVIKADLKNSTSVDTSDRKTEYDELVKNVDAIQTIGTSDSIKKAD